MRGLGQPLILMLTFCVKCWAMSRHEVEDFSNFLRRTSVLDQNLKDGYGPDHESDEVEEVASDDAWEQSGKFEGDLILNDRQRRLIVEDVAEGLSRNGLKDSTKRWPGNEVIYYIQKEHFSSDQVRAIQDGIDDLAQASCVKFKPYQKGDRDAVVIQGSRRGCFSQVGYQGGYQVLNLSGRHPVGRGCFRHGTVVHELLHTLGFFHMQSSPDRDDYIDVIWENIVQPARHNFKKYNVFSVSDFGVGYDYESVLHYGRRAFSNNGKDTLVPKQGGAEIGQRIGLSDKDTQKLNKMYCDTDSNSDEEEEAPAVPQKHHHKKKPSNQPFQGHGIGYHHGKALVIKLPAAETFSLTDKSIHKPLFDYFSKSPKAVLPKSIQEFGIGKKVNEHPTESQNDDKNHFIKELNKKHDFDFSKFSKDFYQPIAIGSTTHKPADQHTAKNSSSTDSSAHEDKGSEGFDLHEHLTELDKIIKSRVYPSQKENDHSLLYVKEYERFQPKSIETTTQKENNNSVSNDESNNSDSKESSTLEEDGDHFGLNPFGDHVYYKDVGYDDNTPYNEQKYKQPEIIKTTTDTNNEHTQEFNKSDSAESLTDDEDDSPFASKSLHDHFRDIDKVLKDKIKGDSVTNDENFLSFRNKYNRLNKLRKGSYFPMSISDSKSDDENYKDRSFLFSSEETDNLKPQDKKQDSKYKYYSNEDYLPPNTSGDYADDKSMNEDINKKPSRFDEFSDNIRTLPYKYQPQNDSKKSHHLTDERDKLIGKSNEKNVAVNDDKITNMSKQQEHFRASAFKELFPDTPNLGIKHVYENIEDFEDDVADLPNTSLFHENIKKPIEEFTHNDNKSNNLTTSSTDTPRDEKSSNPKSEVILLNQEKSVEELEMSTDKNKLESIKMQEKPAKIIRQASFKTLTYTSAEKIEHDAPFATVQPVRYEVINYLPYTSHDTYSPETHDFDTYHIKNKYSAYPHSFPSDYHPYTYDSHYDPDFSKHSGSDSPHVFY